MIERSNTQVQDQTTRLYERLLRLYPPRFRRNFAGEIHAVFLDRMDEPGGRMPLVLLEIAGLVGSILRERWHEWRTRKGDGMDAQPNQSGENVSAAALRSAGVPVSGRSWMVRWILFPLVILPIAKFATFPMTVLYRWILGAGTQVGLWPEVPKVTLQTLGLMTSLGLAAAGTQWLMLRTVLPRPGRWFAATAIGLWLGAIAGVMLDLEGLVVSGRTPDWSHPVELLVIGLILGLTQWLLLRRQIEKAFWFLPIDVVAAISILPIQIVYPYTFLLVFAPGMITGIGIWILLRHTATKRASIVHSTPLKNIPASIKIRIGVGLAVFLFGGLWVNATLMLQEAKSRGAYPTFDEAIIANARAGFEGEGVEIISINVDASFSTPAVLDGKRQHLRRGCANIVIDRIPAGRPWERFPTCTQYVHTRDGWVMIGDTYGPFVGWVMKLYNLERVHQFQRSGES